jgi:hypothetical protein
LATDGAPDDTDFSAVWAEVVLPRRLLSAAVPARAHAMRAGLVAQVWIR